MNPHQTTTSQTTTQHAHQRPFTRIHEQQLSANTIQHTQIQFKSDLTKLKQHQRQAYNISSNHKATQDYTHTLV